MRKNHRVFDPEAEDAAGGDSRIIASGDDFQRFLAHVSERSENGRPGRRLRCAVDTEADSLHSYREKLCLVQFSSDGVDAIIDPLSIRDLTPLREALRNAEVWMHGADFDMLMLHRALGEIPREVFDTQIAARLIGVRKFGLAALIEEFFGVTLSKSSQRADWGKRPLTPKLVEYAINDVHYILRLADRLLARLDELGRRAWFEESCAAARQSFLDRPGKSDDDVWRISGWGKLHRRGLAFLRELWRWRDAEAERLDRPAFKVLGNDRLLELAAKLEANSESTPDLPGRYRSEQQSRYRAAVARARAMTKDEWPERRRRRGEAPPEEDEEAFQELRRRRDKAAEQLDLEPTLLATRAQLERIAIEPDAAPEILMRWQLEALGFPPAQ